MSAFYATKNINALLLCKVEIRALLETPLSLKGTENHLNYLVSTYFPVPFNLSIYQSNGVHRGGGGNAPPKIFQWSFFFFIFLFSF